MRTICEGKYLQFEGMPAEQTIVELVTDCVGPDMIYLHLSTPCGSHLGTLEVSAEDARQVGKRLKAAAREARNQ